LFVCPANGSEMWPGAEQPDTIRIINANKINHNIVSMCESFDSSVFISITY
jgi:hypothetical protein